MRVFGLGALVACAAVAAAVWATAQSTVVAVHDAQQASRTADLEAYDALLGYAATHATWDDVGPLVAELAARSGRRVTLTAADGAVLADAGAPPVDTSVTDDSPDTPGPPWTTVDVLRVDTALLAEAAAASGRATEAPTPDDADLANETDVPAEIIPIDCPDRGCKLLTVSPTAAVDARVVGPFVTSDLDHAPWSTLRSGVDECLATHDVTPVVTVALDRSVSVLARLEGSDEDAKVQEVSRVATTCLDDTLVAMLEPYVAEPAGLTITAPRATATVLWDLSGPSRVRILALAAGVLLMTLLACALLSGWLTRPLRRMAAAARRAGNGDLDARVPQTRRDEVGELARAFNEMAEGRQELEAARRRLTSDVSHELRTPLTNVRGWLEAAQDGLVATDRQLIDGLHEETLHLQLLVEDLHELAVGDAGGMVLERSPVDLGDLLSQVAASFEARARAAGLSTHIDAAPGTLVDADPVRLRQAVANLVANAVRHTPPGGLVTLHATSEVIEVRDTGEGVPAAELPHVFERFRRVDPARGRSTGGSGLGLAIVQQIVTAHGWTVTMTSSQGTDDATPNGTNATSGTTVTIHVRPSATLDPC